MIEFATLTEEQEDYLKIILERIQKMNQLGDCDYDLLDLRMDLTAIHQNDVELDFKRLAEAKEFNFQHDIFGIRKHIDRNTGKLTRGFLPRLILKG